jgi:hypothetical protein
MVRRSAAVAHAVATGAALVVALTATALVGTGINAQEGLRTRRPAIGGGPVGVPQQVLDAVARQGRGRVIVGLSVGFAPEGHLPLAERAQQRADIEAAQDSVLRATAGLQVTGVHRFRLIPAVAMEVDGAALQALARHPQVASIEPDALSTPSLIESTALVGAPDVWASGYTGAGQTVAVIDTGVDRTHPFLAGRVVSEACYSTTSATDGSSSVCPGGTSSATGPGAATPCGFEGCSHGTHVAGIAAGNGSGLSGVAPAAAIVAIQVFSKFDDCNPCIASYVSDQIRGLERVYDLAGTFPIAAVNLSLGGGAYSSQAACDAANPARKAIIDTLRSAGIPTVVASGNDGLVNALSAPACISSAISVGSSTDGGVDAQPPDRVSDFTNSAAFLTLLAPGQWITSSVPGGSFATFAGTSMAAPHVAGAWAVLKSRTPLASLNAVLGALTNTGTPVHDPGNGLTKPRINIAAAKAALAGACSFTVSPTSAAAAAGGGTGSITVATNPGCTWTATSNASFVFVTGGGSGNGPGTVTFSVNGNLQPQPRVGTLTVAGVTVTVTQEGAAVPSVDFNGDGRVDLLWYHQGNGRLATWLLAGTTMTSGADIGPGQVTDLDWRPAGAGDVDGDGRTDVVWQNVADGRVSVWILDGLALQAGHVVGQVADLQWRIRAVGDMDGDGRADLIWQHEGNGALAVWRMNGTAAPVGTLLGPGQVADLNWTIAGTADFDGNGSRDLLWHHRSNGSLAVWFMSATAMTGAAAVGPGQVADLSWQVRAVGDLNGDGQADLVWQRAGSGTLAAWLLNGVALAAGVPLSPAAVPDTNWRIVAPR